MYCTPKQDWCGKFGTILCIMKSLGISRGNGCGVIKIMMDIYQCIQYSID